MSLPKHPLVPDKENSALTSIMGFGTSPLGHAYGVRAFAADLRSPALPSLQDSRDCMPRCVMQFRTSGTRSKVRGGSPSLCGNAQTPDEDAGVEAIKEAVKLGINFFDTAPFYGSGSAEKVLHRCPHCLCLMTPAMFSALGSMGR